MIILSSCLIISEIRLDEGVGVLLLAIMKTIPADRIFLGFDFCRFLWLAVRSSDIKVSTYHLLFVFIMLYNFAKVGFCKTKEQRQQNLLVRSRQTFD